MSLWVASDLWNQQLGRYDMNFTFLLTVTPVAPYNMRHWDGLRFLESTWKNTCLQVSILGWYSWYTSPTDTKTTQKREKFYSENFTCHDCMDISSTDPVCGKPFRSGKVIQETLQQGFLTSDQVPTFRSNKLFDLKLQRLGTNSHRMHVKFTDSNISQIHKKYQLTGGSGSFPIWNILSLNVSIFLAKMFTPHLCSSHGIPARSRVCSSKVGEWFWHQKTGKKLEKAELWLLQM